ncbi:bifunctional adenosine 5'-phosphosulfate phosphorylase/adenylylsulfatase HINT4 isoform X2 [Populus alba]|uniref:bifunctional adenosine 5'-phosphosulfate phosphorylase/adenylylsulfatase HINT4 isoform X2 n=1 Tax=Populus alba TaxID=43335 RepID=UPI00158F5D4B|nr:bifunctional adenosine 5'-phosphosulfate phosphorylase/adenylylsulfatase HINT4 isoform X2 [Populus alba]
MKSEILIFGNSDKLRAIAGVGKWRERPHHVSSARLPPNPLPLLSFTLMTRWSRFKISTLLLSVNHMLNVGKTLLHQDAPQSKDYRFGFHRPPFNSVDHLHLHCLALPFIPRWKHVKYMSLGHHGFVEAEQLLEKIKPS